MTITTVSSREFNQDVSRIKKVAQSGPVFITDRGKPSHVLLNITEYQNLVPVIDNIAEGLAMKSAIDIEFITPKITGELYNKDVFK